MINVTRNLEISNLSISTTLQKVESSNAIAANANDYWLLDGSNISYKRLRRYSDKKT